MPLTRRLRILRGLLFRDAVVTQVWSGGLALVGFAPALVVPSVRRFSKTIE